MDIQSTTQLPRFFQGEGFFLAAIPFLGSFVAFVFEAGYLSFYDVPVTFIQLDFTRVVLASGYVILVLTPFMIGLSFLANLISGSHPFFRVLVVVLVFPALISVILILSPLRLYQWWWMPAALAALLMIRFLLLPFVFKKEEEIYWEIVESGLKRYAEVKPMNSLSQAIDNRILSPILLVFFGSLFTFLLGNNYARSKVSHWVLASRPDMVVVTNYGDTVLLKKILLATKELTDNVEMIKVSDSNKLEIKRIGVGKLKPKEPAI